MFYLVAVINARTYPAYANITIKLSKEHGSPTTAQNRSFRALLVYAWHFILPQVAHVMAYHLGWAATANN